jgi:hypothetical protein
VKIVNLHKTKDYDVYGGRPRKGIDPRDVPVGTYGWLGNPFPIENGVSGSALTKYEEYFYNRILDDEEFRESILSLRDKRVACFCSPKPCHLNIIKNWLERRVSTA